MGFALGAAVAGFIAISLGVGESMSNEASWTVTFWLLAGFVPIALIGNLTAWRFVGRGSDKRLINRVTKVTPASVGERRGVLLHQNADQLLFRVNPAIGVGETTPAIITE